MRTTYPAAPSPDRVEEPRPAVGQGRRTTSSAGATLAHPSAIAAAASAAESVPVNESGQISTFTSPKSGILAGSPARDSVKR